MHNGTTTGNQNVQPQNADCAANAIEGNAPLGAFYLGLALTWIVAQKDSLALFFAGGLANQNNECHFTHVIFSKLVHTIA